MLKRISVALALALAILPGVAHAQMDTADQAAGSAALAATPAEAVSAFVGSVMYDGYDRAWELLSRPSKDYIVERVADDEHLDATEVRNLFNTTDPRVVGGFWTSFRKAFAGAGSLLAGHTPRELSNDGTVAVVEYDRSPAKWTCVRENGAWHVAYAESFLIKR